MYCARKECSAELHYSCQGIHLGRKITFVYSWTLEVGLDKVSGKWVQGIWEARFSWEQDTSWEIAQIDSEVSGSSFTILNCTGNVRNEHWHLPFDKYRGGFGGITNTADSIKDTCDRDQIRWRRLSLGHRQQQQRMCADQISVRMRDWRVGWL